MSSIFIQIGQCGCQIGCKLNQKLSTSYYSTRIHKPNKVHAIMIDTQPKVLRPFIQKPPKWLDPSNVKYFQYGRGNNWSYGYMHELPKKKCVQQFVEGHKQFSHLQNQIVEGEQQKINKFEEAVLVNKYIKENKQICAYTLERTRKQLQNCDCALCINVICSLGGGTGSGLGTKIVQEIKDEFQIDIYGHVVLPNKSGQTPLQIYNCALSLASIQDSCTAIFPYENDNMINMFLSQEKLTNVNDLDIINDGIADTMCRLIKVNDIEGYNNFYTMKVGQCILSKQMNYISLLGSKGKTAEEAFEGLFHKLKVYNQDTFWMQGLQKKREKCLSSNIMMTGKEQINFESQYKKKIKHIVNPMEEVCKIECEHVKNKKDDSQILMLMNHSNILRYLEYISRSGKKKLAAKAYLWHYRYADLQGAFESIDNVVDQYMYFSK